jgi:hypothetical protein
LLGAISSASADVSQWQPHQLPAEIRFARDTDFPLRVAGMQADLAVIAAATMGNPAYDVRYANVVKSINNALKKTQRLLDGFTRTDIKDMQDAEFRAWCARNPGAASKTMLSELDAAIAADIALSEEEYAYSLASHSDLLASASTLYRLALERARPDAKRDPGYQERDLAFITARLSHLEQSFAASVDEARYAAALQRYQKLAARVRTHGLDALVPDAHAVPALYKSSELADTARRLAWIGRDADAFRKSDDGFIKLAVRLNDVATALENRRKDVNGTLEKVIPQYMAAVNAWKKSQGKPVYPDPNSSLRATAGTGCPARRDGLI